MTKKKIFGCITFAICSLLAGAIVALMKESIEAFDEEAAVLFNDHGYGDDE